MDSIRKAIAAKDFLFTEDSEITGEDLEITGEDSEITGPEWFGNLLNSDKAYIDRAIINSHSKVYGYMIRAPAAIYKAKIGDYIILDDTGNVSVCKKYRFKEEYEKG